MSGNREDVLRQFCDVTGADENRSKFFLESSNWQLEEAISSFYEHGGNVDEPPPTAAAPVALPNLDSDSDSDMESTPQAPQRTSKKEKKKTNTKFATLDSLHQESSSDEEEASHSHWLTLAMLQIAKSFSYCEPCPTTVATGTNSVAPNPRDRIISNQPANELTNPECEDECTNIEEIERLKKEVQRLLSENSALRKEIARCKTGDVGGGGTEPGQAFYAGGSERSGQQILGPSKGRKDIVTEVFKSVKERGAVVVEEEPTASSRARGGTFGGVGYRLGQTADDHEPVTPAGAAQAAAGQGGASAGARSVRLRLYREGFAVDQGPLRSYTDPEHADFLNYIRRGEIPPELAHGGEVRVSLEDRRHEEGPRAAASSRAFQGRGQMLGSPTPPTVGATAPVAAAPADRAANQRAAQESLQLDETKPVTTVQFRLADGSRLTGRFNHTHTVADLHAYISRAEPAYQLQPFTLLTSFPSKPLDEPAASLAAADLLNTTLLQRLK